MLVEQRGVGARLRGGHRLRVALGREADEPQRKEERLVARRPHRLCRHARASARREAVLWRDRHGAALARQHELHRQLNALRQVAFAGRDLGGGAVSGAARICAVAAARAPAGVTCTVERRVRRVGAEDGVV